MNNLHFCACMFRREQGSKPEGGIAIIERPTLSNVLLIIDANAKPVTDIWSYELTPSYGAVSLPVLV